MLSTREQPTPNLFPRCWGGFLPGSGANIGANSLAAGISRSYAGVDVATSHVLEAQMQSAVDPFDRRKNRGFTSSNNDDLDLDQREITRRGDVRLPLRLWTEGRHQGKLDFHNCSNLST